MKIDTFYRKNLRNDEHFQFHTEFRDLVNAYAVIEGGELYERFVKTFNSVISKYNAIVNSRHGRRNHKPIAENSPTNGGSHEN